MKRYLDQTPMLESKQETPRIRIAAIISIAVMVLPLASVASSTSFTLGPAVLASGPSPFAGCTVGAVPGADPPSFNYINTTVEPFVAVNPANPNNIIGVYQQDRWSDGGAKALVASRSFDGGLTWSQNFAEFTACSDNLTTAYTSPFTRASDPWVSFDSAGRAYQISLGLELPNADGIEVSTSIDGGATWTPPARLIADSGDVHFNDKESITGDWRPGVGAGKAYATWTRGSLPGFDKQSRVALEHTFAYSGLPMFSKTEDGGQTWSAPVPMIKSVIDMAGTQIVVLPDGTLVNVAAMLVRGSGIQPSPQQYLWIALVSKNGGRNWSAPIKIAPLGTQITTNPDILDPASLDETVRTSDYLPDVAVDRTTGAIYVVFCDGLETGFNHVKLTKSTDGGKNWSKPIDVTGTPASTHSFNGMVEVAADGQSASSTMTFETTRPLRACPPTFGSLTRTMAERPGPSSTFMGRSTWRMRRSHAAGSSAITRASPRAETISYSSSPSQARRTTAPASSPSAQAAPVLNQTEIPRHRSAPVLGCSGSIRIDERSRKFPHLSQCGTRRETSRSAASRCSSTRTRNASRPVQPAAVRADRSAFRKFGRVCRRIYRFEDGGNSNSIDLITVDDEGVCPNRRRRQSRAI